MRSKVVRSDSPSDKGFLGKAQVLGGKLAALLRHGELAFGRLQVALRALGVEPDPGLGTQQIGIGLIRLGLCRRRFPTYLRTGRERDLEFDAYVVGIGARQSRPRSRTTRSASSGAARRDSSATLTRARALRAAAAVTASRG